MRSSIWVVLGPLLAVLAAGAAPTRADSLTVEVAGVRSAQGKMVVSLCADPAAQFPGGCRAYGATVQAAAGTVSLRIDGMAPGRYALQVFHDENGNNRPDIPPEGYAFGNNTVWPPAFADAAVQVTGNAQAAVKMQYMGATGPGAPAQGSRGAEAPAGIVRSDLREQGMYGELYAPQGAKHGPALLLVGGSEGGLDVMSGMATSFAQEGFVVLTLAYFAEQGLPATLENIPLEYFDRALTWLGRQPQVDADRIGMLGWSRGSEAALLTATRNPRLRAVVAVAPSATVWKGLYFGGDRLPGPAWTLRGKPLPSLAPEASAYRPNAPLIDLFLPRIDAMQADGSAQIPVEKIRGGIMLISGGRDAIWPAARFADRMAGRLQALDHHGRFTHLYYPEAGHAVFVGHPEGRMARAVGAAHVAMGGTPVANLAAWQDSWPKTLDFLRTELKEKP